VQGTGFLVQGSGLTTAAMSCSVQSSALPLRTSEQSALTEKNGIREEGAKGEMHTNHVHVV